MPVIPSSTGLAAGRQMKVTARLLCNCCCKTAIFPIACPGAIAPENAHGEGRAPHKALSLPCHL
nr:MAG TPA: hypothetical protein [Caudoviricetes sp.]